MIYTICLRWILTHRQMKLKFHLAIHSCEFWSTMFVNLSAGPIRETINWEIRRSSDEMKWNRRGIFRGPLQRHCRVFIMLLHKTLISVKADLQTQTRLLMGQQRSPKENSEVKGKYESKNQMKWKTKGCFRRKAQIKGDLIWAPDIFHFLRNEHLLCVFFGWLVVFVSCSQNTQPSVGLQETTSAFAVEKSFVSFRTRS